MSVIVWNTVFGSWKIFFYLASSQCNWINATFVFGSILELLTYFIWYVHLFIGFSSVVYPALDFPSNFCWLDCPVQILSTVPSVWTESSLTAASVFELFPGLLIMSSLLACSTSTLFIKGKNIMGVGHLCKRIYVLNNFIVFFIICIKLCLYK